MLHSIISTIVEQEQDAVREEEKVKSELHYMVQRLKLLRDTWSNCNDFGVLDKDIDHALQQIDYKLSKLVFWRGMTPNA